VVEAVIAGVVVAAKETLDETFEGDVDVGVAELIDARVRGPK
jgi:hypothetical protein